MKHRVTTDLRPVADQRSKLGQAGVHLPVSQAHVHIASDQPIVRQLYPRTEMRTVAKHRVADIIEVRHFTAVEQD
jgi:hypothetical protein